MTIFYKFNRHLVLHKQPVSLVSFVDKYEHDSFLFRQVNELFDYDNENGLLIWKVKRKGTNGLGCTAGSVDKRSNRRVVTIDGKNYKHARLVYLYHFGYLANFHIDHIDRNVVNDRIENLRAVTISQNNTNKLGKLVYDNPNGSFSVKLRIQGKFKHIGTFKCQRRATDIAKLSHAIVNAEYSPYHWEMLASNSNDTLMGVIQ